MYPTTVNSADPYPNSEDESNGWVVFNAIPNVFFIIHSLMICIWLSPFRDKLHESQGKRFLECSAYSNFFCVLYLLNTQDASSAFGAGGCGNVAGNAYRYIIYY